MSENKRAVVTLSPVDAHAARRLSSKDGGPSVSLAEVVRRGLLLLSIYTDLDPDEEIVVRNKTTGVVERLRFVW